MILQLSGINAVFYYSTSFFSSITGDSSKEGNRLSQSILLVPDFLYRKVRGTPKLEQLLWEQLMLQLHMLP